ncbi:peptidylprolyl isomerase [Balamuthia mandrillaris]
MLESTKETGLTHRAGTISMARSTPNSATSEFFISLADQPNLDQAASVHQMVLDLLLSVVWSLFSEGSIPLLSETLGPSFIGIVRSLSR